MTVDHSDHDVIDGGHRSAQQLLFTATQLVEVIARIRQQAETRRAEVERAAAQQAQDAARVTDSAQRERQRTHDQQARDAQRATDAAARDAQRATDAAARAAERAAVQQQRDAAAKQRADRATWSAAGTARWRRDATPHDLLTAWAAATTWAGHDPRAAAAMLRTEDEITRRWPNLADRYDRLRVHDGLHPAAAMKVALIDAVNAAWDPTTNPAATRRPPAAARAALLAPPPLPAPLPVPAPDSGRVWADRQPSGPTAPVTRVWADNAADLALRWHPPVSTRTAGPASVETGRFPIPIAAAPRLVR